MTTKRVQVTWTETMWVDLPEEDADRLLKPSDHLDVIEATQSFRRMAAYGHDYSETDVSITDATLTPFYAQAIDGTRNEQYLWSARHFVIMARRELSSGRYREGRCPELDEVNRELGRLEDRLRLMALEVEDPEDSEVVAWRANHPPVGRMNSWTT